MNAAGRGGAVLVLCAAVCGGCVTPATTTGAYETKSARAAEAALSAVRTTLLAEDAHTRGRLTTAYLEPVVVDAEEALDSVQSTFDSVQPPDTRDADELRADLDDLLDRATSGVTDLRIAVRRDDADALGAAAADLAVVGDRLADFAEAHTS